MSIETSTDRSDEEPTETSRSDVSERPETVAEPSEQPDVVDISGLDTEQAARLHEQGISTIEALEATDSETIAEFANVSVEQAVDWLEQARDLASGTEEGPDADIDTDGEEATDEIPSEPPSTFRATIQASPLKTILKALRANVDEARFKIDESGIRVRAVDSANVAMDDLTLNASAFESYDATPGVLGLDLDRFADPVNLAKKDDLVQFILDRETRKLVVFVDKEARLFVFTGDRGLPAVEIRSKVLEIVELSRNRPIDDVSDDPRPREPIDALKEADTILVRRIKHKEKIAPLDFCTVYADMR
jgi:proliferating cell nuclear antigen